MEVADSVVAPVCGLSLSIARANRKGGGERDYNGFHILPVDATVEPEIESSTILQMDKLPY